MNWKWLIAGLVLLAAAGAEGWHRGYDRAEAEGKAALLQLEAATEEERRVRADTYGKALADALGEYQAEVARAQALETSLDKERTEHERTTAELHGQIAAATRGSVYCFSPEFVRMLNEAAGAAGAAGTDGIFDPALPAAGCSAAAAGAAGTCSPAGAGVLEAFTGVSEADLLAWFIAYSRRCRGLETQVNGWQRLAKDWQ